MNDFKVYDLEFCPTSNFAPEYIASQRDINFVVKETHCDLNTARLALYKHPWDRSAAITSIKLHQKRVDLIVRSTKCNRFRAEAALKYRKNDVILAILHIMLQEL
jgi:NACalpha-BTF3-like transcription factor